MYTTIWYNLWGGWWIMCPFSKVPHIIFLALYGGIWWYIPPNKKKPLCWNSTPTKTSGWWFEPLWKILVNWDDYSQYMEKIKNVANHQPDMCIKFILKSPKIHSLPWWNWSKPMSTLTSSTSSPGSPKPWMVPRRQRRLDDRFARPRGRLDDLGKLRGIDQCQTNGCSIKYYIYINIHTMYVYIYNIYTHICVYKTKYIYIYIHIFKHLWKSMNDS